MFHEMHARLHGPNNLFICTKLLIEPDFPCLSDEIAEPRQDMNIKVATFTLSEKSTNTRKLDPSFLQVYG